MTKKQKAPRRMFFVLILSAVFVWMAASIQFAVVGLIINVLLILASVGLLFSKNFRGQIWGVVGRTPPARTPIGSGVGLFFLSIICLSAAGAQLGKGNTDQQPLDTESPVKVAASNVRLESNDSAVGQRGNGETHVASSPKTFATQLDCANQALAEAEKLLIAEDPQAQLSAQRAMNCAMNSSQLEPRSEEAKQLVSQVEKLQKSIEKKTVPTAKERKIYHSLWSQLHGNPDVEEEVVFRRVAKKFGISRSKIDSVWLKVQSYKVWAGKQLENLVRANLSTDCDVHDIIYEPTQDSIIVKLGAKKGWSKSSIQTKVRRDLIRSVGVIFEASPIVRQGTVWIVAPVKGDDVQKVASVEVTKRQYDKFGKGYFARADSDSVGRLNPWLGSPVR